MTSTSFNAAGDRARSTSQCSDPAAKHPSLLDRSWDAMRILCRVGAHKPVPGETWNNGHYFTRCGECGCDLVRGASGGWGTVPKGLRVVWRPRTDSDIDWTAWTAGQDDRDSFAGHG